MENTRQTINAILEAHKINGFINNWEWTSPRGITYGDILFHKYTHADKAIEVLRKNGLIVSDRIPNVMNEYFKYTISVTLNA